MSLGPDYARMRESLRVLSCLLTLAVTHWGRVEAAAASNRVLGMEPHAPGRAASANLGPWSPPRVVVISTAARLSQGMTGSLQSGPSTPQATSAPVVTVTLRDPAEAARSIFSAAVAVVAELIVSVVTVMPAPKLAVVVPWVQCVN